MAIRNGHDEVVVDHAAIYDRIGKVEERMANTLKWIGGIMATAILTFGIYAMNKENARNERTSSILVSLAELKGQQNGLVNQVTTIHADNKESFQVLKEALEEHMHNPAAHHTVDGEPMFIMRRQGDEKE